MLAVHRQHAHTLLAGLAHDNLARHDQDFFRGDRDVLARADGSQGGLQPGSADDSNHDDIRSRKRGQFHQAFGSGKHLGPRPERLAQLAGFGRVANRDGFGPVQPGLLEQQLEVVSRREPEHPYPVRQVGGDFDRAGADRAGAAQEDDVTHVRLTIYDLRGLCHCGWFWLKQR